MSAPYIGNQDYRGYLNYLGSNQGNTIAKQLLKYVGNDAVFGRSVPMPAIMAYKKANESLYKNYQGLSSQPQQTSWGGGGGGGGGYQEVYAPTIDFAAINARARQEAENSVNPWYTAELNNLLAKYANKRAATNQQYKTTVEDAENTLAKTLESNATNRVRTDQDVTKNLSDVANSSDQYQTDQGMASEANRETIGNALAESGLTGGLAKRQVSQQNEQQNITEARQEQQYQDTREQQHLFKTRTMEDLLKSDTDVKANTKTTKERAKFDLDNYIQALSLEETGAKSSLKTEKQEKVLQNTARVQSGLVSAFINSITDPGQRQAAWSAYGGMV